MTGVSRNTVQTWVADPTFPAPVHLGSGSRGELYGKEQVRAWLEEYVKRPKVRAAIIAKQEAERLEREKGQDD
jgi:predicted DNA-binding transcriptional regulator AlpA